MVKAQFYFYRDGSWIQEGQTIRMLLPEIGDNIRFNGKDFKVFDIDVEYDIYDIYLD